MHVRLSSTPAQALLDALAASTQIAAERFSSIRVVRSYAAEGREVAKYGSTIDTSYGVAKKLAMLEVGMRFDQEKRLRAAMVYIPR